MTSLSTNLVTILTTIICLPLESSAVRSIALAYLSVPAFADSTLRKNIYPVDRWFGVGLRGGWRGMGDYAGRLLLVMGVETVCRFVVWEAGLGCAWWFGRRRFQWGQM